MKFRGILVIAALLVAAEVVWCGELLAPFSLESASVLPRGARSLKVGGFTTEVDGVYNNSGLREPLGQGFNRSVSWRKLLDSRTPGVDRAQIQGAIESLGANGQSGYSMADIAGDTFGLVNTRVSVATPAVAYGMTEHWTIAAALPVVYSNVNVSTGWRPNAAFMSVWNQFANDPGKRGKLESFQADVQNIVNTELRAKGYKPLGDERNTEVGDVNLISKYQILKTSLLALALQQRLTVPTGRAADVNKLIDVPGGDGQFDLGVASVIDFAVLPKLTFTNSVFYTAQLPSRKAKRIPVASDETLTPDVDFNTKEDLGDLMGTTIGGRYNLAEVWTLGASYSLQYKSPDRYNGSSFSGERYGYLEEETEQHMQATTVGVNYSTVPLFQKQAFAVPMDFSIHHAEIWDGRNVKRNGLTSAEMVMYF